MIKKILIGLCFILTLMVVSCNSVTYEKIVISSMPYQTSFYEDEEISFEGLEVSAKSNNGSLYAIKDYEIKEPIYVIGKNIIDVIYREFITSFTIEIKEKEKQDDPEEPVEPVEPEQPEEIDLLDYKTLDLLNGSNEYEVIENVLFAKTRIADSIIYYDLNNFVNTNIYGKEALLDERGFVVQKDIKVTLSEGYSVLSAHGDKIAIIDSLEIGDLVIYQNNKVYIFKQAQQEYFKLIFNKLIYERNYLLDVLTKNDLTTRLNELIEKINNNDFDDLLQLLAIIDRINADYQEYLPLGKKAAASVISDLEIEDASISFDDDYSLVDKYTNRLYIGGFRNADTLVYYDASCYRSRNAFGYEVAVDENGYIIASDALVELPENGFILSGHTSTAVFLKKFKVGDMVEIRDGVVYFYTKTYSNKIGALIDYYDLLKEIILGDYAQGINHDYELIKKLTDCFNETLDFMSGKMTVEKELGFDICYNDLQCILDKIASLLINLENQTYGIWYYPFSKYSHDKTVEDITWTMSTLASMGINEILITPLTSDGAIFNNSFYVTSANVQSLTYPGYQDYLSCFIEIAHEHGIKVVAFTQTFMHYEERLKDHSDASYQYDYNGEKSFGSVHYIDICNDNFTDGLLAYYSELVEYDFDGIEFDIIRYSASNLWRLLDKDVLTASEISDPGWTDYAINEFSSLYGVTNLKEEILTNKALRSAWLEYKEAKLINFITSAYNLMKEKNSNIVISAAILENYESVKNTYLQDYLKWFEQGIIDRVEAMNYTTSLSQFERIFAEYEQRDYSENVLMGISSQRVSNDLIVDLLEIRKSVNCGFILYSNSYYLRHDLFVTLMSTNH